MVMIHRSSLSTAVNGANPRNDSAEGTSSNIGEPTEQPSSEGTTLRDEDTTARRTTTSQNQKTSSENANTGSESTTSPHTLSGNARK